MANERDISHEKTTAKLSREAFWFLTHTLIAVIILAVTVGVMSLNHPDPDASSPKLLATILAFVAPVAGSFLLTRIHHSGIATHTWVSGLIFFSLVCVWVLGLPTGNGLCEGCGAAEKLSRTFFSFNHGSGLMGGDGLFIGTWIPLSMIGYAIGAKLALRD
jgi:hypothetical protein